MKKKQNEKKDVGARDGPGEEIGSEMGMERSESCREAADGKLNLA